MRTDLQPLIAVLALGLLGAAGWWVTLGQEPEPEPEPVERILAPTPATSALPVDEAMAAVAELAGSGTIRCTLPDLGAKGSTVRWPFVRADWDGSVLRAVVPSPAGTRVVRAAPADADPDAILADDGPPPVGVLRWSGAPEGSVGGCELTPTSERAVRGRIVGPSGPVGDVQVQVCGDRVQADADGSFTGVGWVGDRCVVYVSDPRWTRALVSLEVGEERELTLSVEPSSGPASRRVVVRGELPAVRALQDPDLSPGARDVLRGWAQDGLRTREARKAVTTELDALSSPPAPPSE